MPRCSYCQGEGFADSSGHGHYEICAGCDGTGNSLARKPKSAVEGPFYRAEPCMALVRRILIGAAVVVPLSFIAGVLAGRYGVL